MEKTLKISHSAKELYNLCPARYKYHYIDTLRGPLLPSALWFGNALDEAFSAVLLSKKWKLTDEEQLLNKKGAVQSFLDKMTTVYDDFGVAVNISRSVRADYYASDFNEELVTKEMLAKLSKDFPELAGTFLEFHKKCSAQLKETHHLAESDREVYNYMCWLSLVEKGKLLIKAYERDILPTIEEVYSIQKRIHITNGEDSLTGLIDFTASFREETGVVYVCDNKTSSANYSADSAATSEQGATYCEAEKIDKFAYCVVIKKIFKKEPKIHTQLIKATIPEETFRLTFDNFDKTVENIKAEHFEPTTDRSACFSYGKICPFYKKCKHGNDEGLCKLPEKK